MTNVAFTSQKLGGVTVRNRIFSPANQMFMCADGRVTERFIAYHEARAAGGVGLIILEAAQVHRTSAGPPKQLTIWDDEAIEGLSSLAARLRRHGASVFIQLFHAGNIYYPPDGSPPWSSSALTGVPVGGIPAIPMTKEMICEISAAYASATRRAAAAGLDGVELHAAHGVLPRQFLAQALNSRTDEYGGSFENRMRFTLEIMRAMRASAPKPFAVGARLGPDLAEGLSDQAENLRAMQMLQEEGLVDFFDLSVSDTVQDDLMAAPMSEPSGYELRYFPNVARQLSVPLLVTGRFRTVDEAATVIRSGQAAMVGMVRAQIADPAVVNKTQQGRADEVRPCIACNQRCIAGIATGNVGCAINPAAGFEAQLGDHRLGPAPRPKRVFVVGGGVAGMEAARVAAVRGHSVVLHEAQSDLGGKVRLVSQRASKMSTFGDVSFWQESELRRLGVEIHTSSYVTASEVDTSSADVFIVATGSIARMDGFQRHHPGHVVPGTNLPHVMSSIDLLCTPAARFAGTSAVVLDDTGHYEAIAAAEYLIDAGAQVAYVTRFASFAPLMEATFRSGPAYRRMNRTGRFKLYIRALLDRIDPTSVTLFDPVVDPAPTVIHAETVVLVSYNMPDNELARELTGSHARVVTIGDALSPRYIESAIREGYDAGIVI